MPLELVMIPPPLTVETLQALQQLLLKRLAIIGDRSIREHAPEQQLRLLAEVSDQISLWHTAHREKLPPRLNHFLTQASFNKALDWIKSATTDHSLIESSASAVD